MALRQERLKLMIAYSTVAQIVYLFIVFPLAGVGDGTAALGHDRLDRRGAAADLACAGQGGDVHGGGIVAEAVGHDRIRDLGGFGRVLPLTATTFGLAGLSLMGIPPSGGFIAKCLLLTAAAIGGHLWLALTILAGGLHAGGYVFRVMDRALATPAEPLLLRKPIPLRLELIPLILAVLAVALGSCRSSPSASARSAGPISPWRCRHEFRRPFAGHLAARAAGDGGRCLWRAVPARVPGCSGSRPSRPCWRPGSCRPARPFPSPCHSGWRWRSTSPARSCSVARRCSGARRGPNAASYLRGKPGLTGFCVWWLLTLAGSLGVLIVADIAGFYLLFTLASLSAYGLVAHEQTDAPSGPASSTWCWRCWARPSCSSPSSCWRPDSPIPNPLIRDAVAALRGSPMQDGIVAG